MRRALNALPQLPCGYRNALLPQAYMSTSKAIMYHELQGRGAFESKALSRPSRPRVSRRPAPAAVYCAARNYCT